MIQIEEAVQMLKAHFNKNPRTIQIPVWEGYGYVIMEDVYAPISVPNFPKSAMDGYAIQSKDSGGASKDNPAELQVIGVVFAGDNHKLRIGAKEAVRIMTGGMIPEGADAVIMQENTDYGEGIVKLYEEQAPFQNYCKIGEDIAAGSLAIRQYTKLNSIHIGILTGLGIHTIRVIQPLKISLITTGNELNDLMLPLDMGKIYNSCGYMLAAKLQAAGMTVIGLEKCADKMDDIKLCIRKEVKTADIIITTGGVSVGEADLIPDVLKELDADILFHRINVKPGTPVMGSSYKGKLLLSLSGNPFAALTTFELLFWPIAAEYMKNTEFDLHKCKAVYMGKELKSNHLRRYIRAYYKEGIVTLPSDVHASSVLSNMEQCNCLMEQPQTIVLNKYDEVDVVLIKYL